MYNAREELMKSAYEFIYKKGYYQSGLNEIIEHTEVTKGALYHYFKSKKDLMQKIIQEKITHQIVEYWQNPILESKKPYKNLFELLKKIPLENHNFLTYGNFLTNLIAELGSNNDFKDFLNIANAKFEGIVKTALVRGVYSGELKSDIDIEKNTKLISNTLHGIFLQCKLHRSEEIYIEQIKDLKRSLNYLKN